MPQVEGGPEGLNSLLESVYNSCMTKGELGAERCAKSAWGAVKNAGWSKEGEIWKKNTEDGNFMVCKLTEVKLPEGMKAYQKSDKPKDKGEGTVQYPTLTCPNPKCDYWKKNPDGVVSGTEKCPKCEALLVGGGEAVEDKKPAPKMMKEKVKLFIGDTVVLRNVEVFKVGTWNGDHYTSSDLKQIESNFKELSHKVKPPLKIGHSEDQKFLKEEGLPAAGWVSRLKQVGDTLFATITNVPKKIAELIKDKAYRRVSSEIYPEYSSGGKTFKNVFRAVALLGGDIPAIDSLEDVKALYTKEKKCKLYSFSLKDFSKGGDKMKTKVIRLKEKFQEVGAVAGEIKEEIKTELTTEVKDAVDAAVETAVNQVTNGEGFKEKFQDVDAVAGELKEQIKTNLEPAVVEEIETAVGSAVDQAVDAAIETVEVEPKKKPEDAGAAELAEAQTRIKDLEEELANKNKELTKTLSEQKKTEIKAFIKKLKDEGRLLPKFETLVTALLSKADDSKVIKFKSKDKDGIDVEAQLNEWDLIKKIFSEQPEIVKFAEISKDGDFVKLKTEEKLSDGRVVPVEGAELDLKAKKYAEEHDVDYSVALIEVSKTE